MNSNNESIATQCKAIKECKNNLTGYGHKISAINESIDNETDWMT